MWGYFLENVWLSETDFLWSILSFSVCVGVGKTYLVIRPTELELMGENEI